MPHGYPGDMEACLDFYGGRVKLQFGRLAVASPESVYERIVDEGWTPSSIEVGGVLTWIAQKLAEGWPTDERHLFGWQASPEHAPGVDYAASRLKGRNRAPRGRPTAAGGPTRHPSNMALALEMDAIAKIVDSRTPDYVSAMLRYAAERLRGAHAGSLPRGRRKGDAVSLETTLARRYLGARVLRWQTVLRERYRLAASPKLSRSARGRLVRLGFLRQTHGGRTVPAGPTAPLEAALERVHRETEEQIAIDTLRDCVEVARSRQRFAAAARRRVRRELRDEALTIRGLYPDTSDLSNRLRARRQI